MLQKNGYRIIIVLLLILTSNSFADLKLVIQNKAYSQQKTIDVKTTYYLNNNYLKVESSTQNANILMIFDKEAQKLYLIDSKQKSYSLIDKNLLKIMSKSYEERIQKVEKEIKKLPKEQQEAYYFAKNAKKNTKYVKSKESKKISNWLCTKYKEMVGKFNTKDLWTADNKTLNIEKSDFQILDDMGKFFETAKELQDQTNLGNIAYNDKYGGFPVFTIIYMQGKKIAESKLESISKEKFEKSFYVVPKDYKLITPTK